MTSKLQRRIGWGLTGLVGAFMAFDSTIKLVPIQPVIDSFRELGFPVGVARPIGIMELVILALYLVPRTSVLGAVLLTGVMGGAIASHVRIEDPLFSHTLFGVYLGALAWLGLWLRDDRLRAMIPLRRP
jgi:hypothetical protein